MNTTKYAAILKLACVAALVSSSPTYGATQLETLPIRVPSCEVDATVQIKFNTEPQPLTYKVRSYYWDHGAIAFRIERGKFAMAAYENRPKKACSFWLMGWDPLLANQLAKSASNMMLWPYRNLAHLGDILDLHHPEPSSELISLVYSPWEKVVEDANLSIFRRKVQDHVSDQVLKKSPRLPPTLDRWTTATIRDGKFLASIVENDLYTVKFDDYTADGIPAFVGHTALHNRYPPPYHAVSIESRANNIRLLDPQDTEENILPQLTRGLRLVRELPYTPPEILAREASRNKGAVALLLEFVAALLYPALLPLSAGIIVLLIVRKLRLF